MSRFLAVTLLGSVALAQSASSSGSKAVQDQSVPPAALESERTSTATPGLPALPRGKSTVIGGTIRGVDTVRDQFTLDVVGGRPMKVLFDQRTHVYRDGITSNSRDLRAGNRVSVETVLDGTTVFARSIHLLSVLPQGECQGQVMNYDPASREVTVRDSLSREPIRLRVAAGTMVVRQGQAVSASGLGSGDIKGSDINASDLAAGTLISVKFQSDESGHGVASQIAILATPGAAFVFAGNVVSLDMHSGLLVLVDPRDDKRYEVFFEAARLPMSREVHEGADVTLTADFDGARYVARAITINAASGK
jgi:Domain of unknown function (DUF5666)